MRCLRFALRSIPRRGAMRTQVALRTLNVNGFGRESSPANANCLTGIPVPRIAHESFSLGKSFPRLPLFTHGGWTESGDSLHSANSDLWIASAQPITMDENLRANIAPTRAWRGVVPEPL